MLQPLECAAYALLLAKLKIQLISVFRLLIHPQTHEVPSILYVSYIPL